MKDLDPTNSSFATEIQEFQYNLHRIRTVYLNGEIWFFGLDICKVLEIKNPSNVFSRLNKADLHTTEVRYGLQFRNLVIVNESGLYDIILDSRKPEARIFRRWITKEVLPSIRKTGKYEIPGLKDLSEDERRIAVRDQIKRHNPKLSAEAQKAGVGNTGVPKQDAIEFAIFHNRGYQGLYGGLGKKQIARKKGVSEKANILDYMNSTELAANFFRVTQTEERLKNSSIFRKEDAYDLHELVGKKVREAMIEIGGVYPEDIPFVENIKKLKKQKSAEVIEQKPIQNDPPQIVIDISRDLWKIALLIMSTKPSGIITTRELIEEIPDYISIPEKQLEISKTKKEPKYYQIIRNLKSNKKTSTNLIRRGYAIDIRNGFQITEKGIDFVKETFRDFV